jgi:FdhE protein
VRLTLLPTLAHSSAAYEPIIEARGGTGPVCPCCGEWALLAESRGLERRRFLRCGRCALGWPMARLGCPSCGPGPGPDRAMVSRSFEGQSERYRLLSCGLCGLRLKVLATLDRLTPPGLLVAELATLHLDQIPDAN